MSTLRMRIITLIRQPAFAAAGTFVVILATALGTWWLVREQSLQTARSQFEQRTAHITSDLQQELATCEYVLRSASGVFVVSPTVTPDAWLQYVTRLDMDDTLSIVRALGYAELGPGATAPGGAAIATGQQAQPFAPVTLMTPVRAGAPAAGYDLGRDPTRRAALLRALDTGELTLDARAAQASTMQQPAHPHFELYLPVYGGPSDSPSRSPSGGPSPADSTTPASATLDDAPTRVAGVLVAVVDPRRLFERGMAHQWGVDLQVFAGAPSTSLYTSEAASDAAFDSSPVVRRAETLRFGGEPLTLVYTTSERYLAAGNDYAAMTVLLAGLVSATLLAGVAWLLARTQGRSP